MALQECFLHSPGHSKAEHPDGIVVRQKFGEAATTGQEEIPQARVFHRAGTCQCEPAGLTEPIPT